MAKWQPLWQFPEFGVSRAPPPQPDPPAVSLPATEATAVAKTEPLAIWSLVLGIVSLFACGFIFGVPGVICGHLALSHIRRNTSLRGHGMAVAGLAIGYTSIMLWLIILITLVLGVAISKLGKTTTVGKGMSVQADVQAIKTQLQLYESMNGFFPTTEQGLQALVTSRKTTPDPLAGISCSKNCQRIPGAVIIFIAVWSEKSRRL
jgi:hypothetical protein